MTRFVDAAAFHAALAAIAGIDEAAHIAARERQSQLTKPPGSLGRLEDIACFLAGWQGSARPHIDAGHVVIFAGNHGVAALGISAFPPEVTAQMVANFEAGGAAINALSGAAGLSLKVVPLDLDRPTVDFTQGSAMDEDECLAALNSGAAAVPENCDLLVLGEMGIANSTAAAALAARSFGGSGVEWVGHGTGVDADGFARKIAVVDAGLAAHAGASHNPFETLRRVGGRETAAIAGAVLEARLRRIPVMLDGFICCAAVAPLAAACPEIVDHCLAAHRSAETGHRRLLDRLALDPLLDLDMRLGEGSGAAVAVTVLRAALAAHNDMATFAEAGVSGAA
jgi:nicotinate-nucleotide--dimethylbenzimidazole phosphoribosyltransferase